MEQSPLVFSHLEQIAAECGESIARSILARVSEFPNKEKFLASVMNGGMESVPSQILWLGLQEEAGPILVVYKLVHEALSSTPSMFRYLILNLLCAQPERFSPVFIRETLWSVVARPPDKVVPEDIALEPHILKMMELVNRLGFWRRSEMELQKDASVVSLMLNSHGQFNAGLRALRHMQKETGNALARGNLVVLVPAKLQQYANSVREHGSMGQLPTEEELADKVNEIANEQVSESIHISVPIDLLLSEVGAEAVDCFIFVRSSLDAAGQEDLRRKSLYIRYFLKRAFPAYSIDNLRVRLAFYLDPNGALKPSSEYGQLFHPTERVGFQDFWKIVTDSADGHTLIDTVREQAAAKLRRENLVKTIKTHFAREGKPPSQASLF